MQVHYEQIGLVHLKKDGTIYNRSSGNTTIKDQLNFTTDHRILPNSENISTNGYPDIRTYLQEEAAAGFQPVQVGQYFVITMKT
jgi:hypothetical protein